eukprot:scaffold312535_cov34-Prasinocladus_malaysianus.AAC.1
MSARSMKRNAKSPRSTGLRPKSLCRVPLALEVASAFAMAGQKVKELPGQPIQVVLKFATPRRALTRPPALICAAID